MSQPREKILAWVAAEVLPHESSVRGWLIRAFGAGAGMDVDDVIQEAYCRLSMLTDIGHIASSRAYFFQTARNIVLEQMRRARIVRLEAMTELQHASIIDDEPSPERIAGGRRELARVMDLIASLPDRCRTVIELRKIHGLSQREIARRLGVSENVVENDSVRGLRMILKALAEGDELVEAAKTLKSHERRAFKQHR
jgi:RNA polymerase sigma factor (sigma-70 family)